MVSILIFLVIVIILFTYINYNIDRLRKYSAALKLEKANLAYSTDYQKVKDLVLPARQSVFNKVEPVIWLYRSNETEYFLGANHKNDVRIWLQPNKELKGVHIVLDGTQNNFSKTNLILDKLPKQKIDLESDFSNYFKLYCNEGQQIVALQIIAPDVMSYLLDNLLHVDIEIIDNQVAIIVKDGASSLNKLKVSIELANRLNKLIKATSKVTIL